MLHSSRREFLTASAGAIALSCGSEPVVESKPPNLLLFFPDQLRFDWTGANKAIAVRTPNLDKLRARGVSFNNCYCASPLCAPSRACLASGMEYDNCGVPGNAANYPLDQTTHYTLLRDGGYHVMGCGKFDLHKPEPSWGVDGQYLISEWGFSAGIDSAGKWDAIRWGMEKPCDPYTNHLHMGRQVDTHHQDFLKRREIGTFAATFPTPLPEEYYCDNWIGSNGMRLLKDAPADKPWYLAINFAGPHEPVDITTRMDDFYKGVDFPQPNRSTEFTPEKHVEIRRNYSAMIENLDQWLGRFVDELEARGELENTVIAFSSDHGEMLGDHNLWMKNLPQQASVGVPMVAAGPGIREGVQSDALVSVMDLAATFLDYGGVKVPSDMDSRSFRPVLEGESESHREVLISGLDPWRCISDGRMKLVRGYAGGPATRGADIRPYETANEDTAPRLFDIQEDPLENNDLAGQSQEDVERLTDVLHGLIGVG